MSGPGQQVINLCFHGIGAPQRPLEPGEAPYWIGSAVFEAVLDEVADRTDVVLSFDDGNASDHDIGLEALLARGLTATFFVLAGRLDAVGSLSRSQVVALRDAGLRIGTHGMDHRPWRGLDPTIRERELVQARDVLADLVGEPVTEAALPLGQYDRALLGDLKRLGYQRVHPSDRRRAASSAWLQPRFSLREHDTLQSVRHDMLTPQPWLARARGTVVGAIKRAR